MMGSKKFDLSVTLVYKIFNLAFLKDNFIFRRMKLGQLCKRQNCTLHELQMQLLYTSMRIVSRLFKKSKADAFFL